MIDLPIAYASECRRLETKFLSAGIHYPELAYNAAAEHGLTSSSFAFPSHRVVFGWLCELAERGRTLTEAEFCHLNDIAGRPFEVPYRRDEFYWFEPWSTGIDLWAERVASLASVRDRLDEMKTEMAELLGGVVCQAA